MSKLQKLYEIQQNLKEFGVELNPELEGQLRALEEELIKNEILPVLTEQIEPALKQVQRELVLVVDYVPGEDLKVHLSRKRNLSDVLKDAVEISPKGIVVRGGLTAPRSASYGFTVRFTDGTTITHSSAKQTFIEALQHMSLQKVSAFHARTFADFPLVGTCQRITEDGYKWQEQVDGWWVYVNMSNDTKMSMLQQVAKFLNVALSIEVDGEQQPEPAPMKEPNKRVLYSLNGGTPQNKRQSVYAAIKLYMRQNPLATFAQIKNAFPRELQGSYGVIATMDEIHHRMELGQDAVNRYFLDEDKILKSADGIRFAVCNQWGDQFPAFQRHVETLGWWLEEIQQ
jgi:hypothetical protein